MWKEADADIHELFNLMEKVQCKFTDREDNRLNVSELRRCSWNQVMIQVREISVSWESSPRRISKSMQCIDKLGRNSEVFQSWLDLLPAGDYGSSIAGVFTLMIGAAGRYKKVQEEIFVALADIPEIIEHSQRYVKIYADTKDHYLEKRTFELFRTILRALINIMRFFNDSAFRKLSESFLKQKSYKDEITSSVKEVAKCAEKLREEALQCLHRRTHQQGRLLEQVSQNGDLTVHMLGQLYKMLRTGLSLYQGNNRTEETNNVVHLLLQQTDATTSDSSFDHALEPVSKLHGNLETREQSAVASTYGVSLVIQLLCYDPSITSSDVDTCFESGLALDEMKKARAAALAIHPKFEEFMSGDLMSSALLINGRADLSATEGISPLSFVMANLVRVSEQMKSLQARPYVVKYFCSQHPPFYDSSGSPSPVTRTIMATLVGQLLDEMTERGIEIDLSELNERDRKRVRNLRLKVLIKIFRILTFQIPPKSVLLCIIDDLSRYEIGSHFNDVHEIVGKLTQLVKDHDKMTFKLLVTCEGRALEISQYFTDQTVDLAEEVEPADSDSWKLSRMGKQGMS
ncbi:hypothetical protein F4808DRAFT_265975 [Astrocystis sublimbata]|nr:hypothetical protein F4808DRAFT_265975 [Astrocystis sublimbata]